jgi:hypothetical protein
MAFLRMTLRLKDMSVFISVSLDKKCNKSRLKLSLDVRIINLIARLK